MQEKLLTTKELANELNVVPMTINRWKKKGLPYLQASKNGTVRFILKDVVKWLKEKN